MVDAGCLMQMVPFIDKLTDLTSINQAEHWIPWDKSMASEDRSQV